MTGRERIDTKEEYRRVSSIPAAPPKSRLPPSPDSAEAGHQLERSTQTGSGSSFHSRTAYSRLLATSPPSARANYLRDSLHLPLHAESIALANERPVERLPATNDAREDLPGRTTEYQLVRWLEGAREALGADGDRSCWKAVRTLGIATLCVLAWLLAALVALWMILVDIAKHVAGCVTGPQGTISLQSLSAWLDPAEDSSLDVLLCGPNRSGKTTLLFYIKLGTFVQATPTVAPQVESFVLRPATCFNAFTSASVGMRLKITDAGRADGESGVYSWWRQRRNFNAILYVVNASTARPSAVREEVTQLLMEFPAQVPIVVLLHKTDLPTPLLSLPSFIRSLMLSPVEASRITFHRTSALSGEGIVDVVATLRSHVDKSAAGSYGKYSSFCSSPAPQLWSGTQSPNRSLLPPPFEVPTQNLDNTLETSPFEEPDPFSAAVPTLSRHSFLPDHPRESPLYQSPWASDVENAEHCPTNTAARPIGRSREGVSGMS